MMHDFVAINRDELIERCRAKVAERPQRIATEEQLSNGIPIFLDQLNKTLLAEEYHQSDESLRISGSSGGETLSISEVGISAAAHGKQLLALGYSVSQVVHDYGDLCQAITDLAFERNKEFTIDEYRTLNRCLDNAIADAVTEFNINHDAIVLHQYDAEANMRLGFLVHEIRNSLGSAMLAFNALLTGNMPLTGATGAVLKRSLQAARTIVNNSLDEVRTNAGKPAERQIFSVNSLVTEAKNSALLSKAAQNCTFTVQAADLSLMIYGNRGFLLAALTNLVQNAMKFTHPYSEVTLRAHSFENRVQIDVMDHCGGLLAENIEKMFVPFSQSGEDKSGLGLGLVIARQQVELDQGTLTVRNMPGTGCVFTISLPLYVN